MCIPAISIVKEMRKSVLKDTFGVIVDDKMVHVDTLMGESKNLQSYFISEVNLMDNYVILKRRK
ncbi:CooT family nickel-binding protein [bacterium]|nr:CooT family nickel-binding protein [bacterium]